MKSYRVLTLVILCVALAGGWFSLARGNTALADQYEKRVAAGRAAAEIGATREVQEQMRAALALRPSFDLAEEFVTYMRDNAPQDMYVDELEKLVATYPERAEGYELLAAAHAKEEKWSDAYAVLEAAAAREVTSATLTSTREAIAYRYTIAPQPYPDASPFTRFDIGIVHDGKEWAYVDAEGTTLDGRYEAVSPYWAGQRAVISEGLPQFVDDKAKTSYVATRAGYSSYGLYVDGLFDATLPDGTATFLTDAFRPAFGETRYEAVTAFVGGLAGALQGGTWSVLNRAGESVGSGYAALAIDESRILVGQDRYFAKVGSSFQLFDTKGARIGDGLYENARPFDTSGPAAVQIGGLWGFVDASGAVVIEPAYEDARSFANGLAAVRTGGLWGYVSPAGDLVIPATFRDATRFSAKGTALVLTDNATTPAAMLDLGSPATPSTPAPATTTAPAPAPTTAPASTTAPNTPTTPDPAASTPLAPVAPGDATATPTTPADQPTTPSLEATPGWRLLELVRFQ
ncbi:WG repeat-containing protein [Sanguibacter sp. A247]|uniref:WG repeat-containing protein n=1 Tax=unclassified Sanguibacter TaxID=2645534 RepID=UPI003FD73A49